MIGSSQHGYVKGKSCLTKLIALHDDIGGLVEEGREVYVLS